MALLEAEPKTSGANTTTSVFEQGNHKPTILTVETSSTSTTLPPKSLLITTPTTKGTYPVILFLHGFYLRNSFYSHLLLHISSHGYIVVAPQLYQYIPPSGSEEINDAARVKDWLPEGLQSHLPQDVEANLEAIALVGHSRGGKTAFSLALGYGETALTTTATSPLKYSLLVGIDPVGGMSKSCQTDPKILTFVPHSFNIPIPITVIGSGLGPEKANWVFPPCAPDGVNHKEFFNECKPPCGYFVAKDYGHMDMLDDNPSGLVGALSNCICKNGKEPREPMRRSVGGIVVAFLRAYLAGESGDLEAIVNDPGVAPAKLEPVEFIKA